jgi:transcriptional regulator with GAF, ATPase, and Fis domain
MQVFARLHNLTQAAACRVEGVVEDLQRADVTIVSTKSLQPNAANIVLFNELSPGLYNCLHDTSGGGSERLLAIVLPVCNVNSAEYWRLLQSGASDVLVWDSKPDFAACVAARLERWQTVDTLVDSPLVKNNLVGNDPTWKRILRQIVEVARFTTDSVLILGESGTGKELAARLIHTLHADSEQNRLVVLDCTTIVPGLSGSEFFGHERGAFTGAAGPRDGAFALANGGSLFLDEVGELPLALQAQLLRVIQERTYKRVGGNQWHRSEFRLLCATNRDLSHEIDHGTFRSDLYYRIAAWVFQIPSLRDRTEDILPLTRHFLRELSASENPPEIEEPVREYLLKRNYCGNVRELRQLVARIYARHVGAGPITVGDIPEDDRPSDPLTVTDWRDSAFNRTVHRAVTLGAGLKDLSQYVADTAVRIAISEADGNLQCAARKLGVSDRALQMRRANGGNGIRR